MWHENLTKAQEAFMAAPSDTTAKKYRAAAANSWHAEELSSYAYELILQDTLPRNWPIQKN